MIVLVQFQCLQQTKLYKHNLCFKIVFQRIPLFIGILFNLMPSGFILISMKLQTQIREENYTQHHLTKCYYCDIL